MLRRLFRWIGSFIVTVAVVAVVLVIGGFFWFVRQIPSTGQHLARDAAGIVVLTGAPARIPDAIQLLAGGHGQRLLITGVNRSTRAREIARLTPLYARFFACCIDLDRSALNTFGNAIQTRRWAHEHHFKSLIVVTSNWHMPRAMVEIRHQLPDVELIPYPVISENVLMDPWWSHTDTARFLAGEYVKYLAAQAHLHTDRDLAE